MNVISKKILTWFIEKKRFACCLSYVYFQKENILHQFKKQFDIISF